MKACRAVVAVLAVVVWALSAPLAMASGGCMAMGASCEGPCGTASCVIPGPIADRVVAAVARVVMEGSVDVSSVTLVLPEPPPRSLLSSV